MIIKDNAVLTINNSSELIVDKAIENYGTGTIINYGKITNCYYISWSGSVNT